MTLHRREALELLLGAGALVALGGCRSDASDSAGSLSSALSSPEATAPEVVSLEAEVRDLKLSLWAEASVATIAAGLTSDVYSFGAKVIEGDPGSITPGPSYLGPTIHLRPGQRVQISFENRLEDESIVHWHGLVVPQDQDGQPADSVDPGETYDYDFVVDNDPGTYWYHPHPHAKTGEQVYRGLAGMLLIHGDEPDLPSGANDLSLVLQDRTIGADGQLQYVGNMRDQMAGFVGSTLVTNGVADLVTMVNPEPYRLRILNGANSRTSYLTLSTGDPITAIAVDGHLLPEARTIPGLVITPAQRTDLWIDFSNYEAGQRIELLSANTFNEAGNMMGGGMGGGGELSLDPQTAMTFVVSDAPSSKGELPASLGRPVDFGLDDAINPTEPKEFVLTTRRGSHWINDLQWEGRKSSEPEQVKAGTIEVWDFVGQSPLAHPMHVHGKSFSVIGRTWDDESAADSWAQISDGIIDDGLRDTVLVWPGQRVRIAVPIADHLGYFLYHCHILEHEDDGMMRNFNVSA